MASVKVTDMIVTEKIDAFKIELNEESALIEI